ncbi:hypothetical protein GWI33_017987 [Rhynchophorus ferrugineus]|uniref:FHA domain-containing protein n=1 Tax=Rhynchophorus ferrugineus TaxID=354439 RepID=A0A834HXI2_RHYFE|nr:hypothetical protein GWI33_017987 [Rhynchophorus ferrugineus]
MSMPRVKWFLKQLHTNKLFEIDPSDCVVGRSLTAQVILNSAKSSRTHSSFVVNLDGHLLLQDLSSANGTFVNGVKLDIYKRHKVRPGDIIGFGISNLSLSEDDKDRCVFFEVIKKIPVILVSSTCDDIKTEEPDVIDLLDSPDEDDNSAQCYLKQGEINPDDLKIIKEPTNTVSTNGVLHQNDSTASKKLKSSASLDISQEEEDNLLNFNAGSNQGVSTTTLQKSNVYEVIPELEFVENVNSNKSTKPVASDNVKTGDGLQETVTNSNQEKRKHSSFSDSSHAPRTDKEREKMGTKKHKIDINQDSVLEISSTNNKSHKILNIVCEDKPSDVNDSSSKDNQDISAEEMGNKSAKNSFSTIQDASVIIDITDDNEEDFSSSQIFQMSEMVKTEVQDDNFQKIKMELAEMDFCDQEFLLNLEPINLENDAELSGFENTQDIRAYLEGDSSNQAPVYSDGVRSRNGDRDSGFSVGDEGLFENSINEKSAAPRKNRKAILTEPHQEIKTTKKPAAASKRNSETNENGKNKRKKVQESPSEKNKTTATPKLLVHCGSKTIENELKKRRSRSGSRTSVEIDRAAKESIKGERRRKLKQLEESKPKGYNERGMEERVMSPVKVVPQSKSNRDKYELKPIDLPKITKNNNYNLRKDGGENVNAEQPKSILPEFPKQVENSYNTRNSKENNDSTAFVIPKVPDNKPRGVLSRTRVNETHPSHTHAIADSAYIANSFSSRLMHPNTGRNSERGPPARRLKAYNTDDIIHKIIHWFPKWLIEQMEVSTNPPINEPPAKKIPLHFRNFEQYYDVFSKLILLEKWHYISKGHSIETARKTQIRHLRVNNNLLYIDCVYYITETELRKGSHYKSDDFLLIEYKTKDSAHNYLSLNFGFVQRFRRTEVSQKDLNNVPVSELCSGTPHSCIELTIVLPHQADKRVENRGFALLKLAANIGGYLKQIKAVKCLADSPLCKMILYPRVEDYKVASVSQHELAVPNHLNPQQKQIVLEASNVCVGNSSGIYCIKGPPGTGKTSVIINIVYQVLMSSYVQHPTEEPPRILVAAPSNTAVDNLLSKLVARKHSLVTECKKLKGKIKLIRVGPESSMSSEGILYSLTSLARKHLLFKNQDVAQFKEAKDRKENMTDFAKKYFGRNFNQELKVCEEILIKNSNIICTTLNSCVNGKLIDAVDR